MADLSPVTSTPQSSPATADENPKQDWELLEIPPLRTVSRDEANEVCKPKVGLLVATEIERQAVLKRMRPPRNKRAVFQVYEGKNTYFIGRLGVTEVVLCMTAMGSTGRDASTIVTAEMIQLWQLVAVIMSGIAFGKDASKQEIGNVLVSDRIICYEPERIGESVNEDRGSQPMAGAVLLNRFRHVVGWSFKSPAGKKCGFQIGPVLSGEKLVDNAEFKQQLFSRFPTAIGGEMEGAGFAAAAERNRCEWIVAKSICDWGDGTKKKQYQAFAAAASIDLVSHVLNQPGALDSLGSSHSQTPPQIAPNSSRQNNEIAVTSSPGAISGLSAGNTITVIQGIPNETLQEILRQHADLISALIDARTAQAKQVGSTANLSLVWRLIDEIKAVRDRMDFEAAQLLTDQLANLRRDHAQTWSEELKRESLLILAEFEKIRIASIRANGQSPDLSTLKAYLKELNDGRA